MNIRERYTSQLNALCYSQPWVTPLKRQSIGATVSADHGTELMDGCGVCMKNRYLLEIWGISR